ncbi:MAG TPA: hypothetical protein VHH90_00015 [Polyangia bacterium]|nr:hypothetical protein [Polyangia bacterium]
MKTRATCMGIAFVSLLGTTSCGVPAEDQPAAVAIEAAIASCDGSWTVTDSPNVGGGDNALASVSGARADDVWAVGQFAPDTNPDITLTLAEHFDGQAWSVVETPNLGTNHGNALLAVAALSGRAWAVGYDIGSDYLAHSLIEAWDGSAWTVVSHHQPFETENLYGVAAVAPDDVWAVGSGRDGEGPFQAVALHFDGHHWRSIPPVDPGRNGNVLYSVAARSADDVWAVGQQIGDAPPDRVLVEHWDGRRWSVVPVDAPADASKQLLAVDLVGRDDFRAVGDSQDGTVSLRTLAVIGEGNALAANDTPNPNLLDDRLTGVAAISDDQTFAVGSTLDDSSGGLQTLIVAGGEGGPWTRVASPNPSVDGNNQLAMIAKVSGDLWAVGGYDGPDAGQTLILHRCRR